jgi:hypothetical protein
MFLFYFLKTADKDKHFNSLLFSGRPLIERIEGACDPSDFNNYRHVI